VAGHASVQAAVHPGQIYFFWGDTARPSYPQGLFNTAGAPADLPGKGGLDPSVGINYHYFTGADGFARGMVPRPEPNPVWIDGVLVVKDDAGQERMLAHASLVEGLVRTLESSLILWDDQTSTFKKLKTIDVHAPLAPTGHPFRVTAGGTDYFYFPTPYPDVRVPATWRAVQDLDQYEGYTCLKPGTRYDKQGRTLDRSAGGGGKLNWAWKKRTPPLSPKELAELVEAKKVRRDELPFRLQDAETAKPILLHGGSVNWNAYRKKYVMIALESMGASAVGEVYYAEAPRPEGPWIAARKIVTHDLETGNVLGKQHERMDFYNPMQHPFFDQEGGRLIYFEGTYTNTFSGNPCPTPLYEYNNQMYRLDLSDPALKLK
jgi:hypothetical protein